MPAFLTKEEDDILISRLQNTMAALTSQIQAMEEGVTSRMEELLRSRVQAREKDSMLLILARRIAHLAATDKEGHFVKAVWQELEKAVTSSESESVDFDLRKLQAFMEQERKRVMVGPILSLFCLFSEIAVFPCASTRKL